MEIKKILSIFVLVALFSTQIVLAKPTSGDANVNFWESRNLCNQKSTYETLAATEKDNSLTASVQLLKITLFNMLNLSLTYATKAKNISELLLKDPTLNNNNSPEVTEFKNKILKFQENYDSCKNIDNLFKLVNLYSTSSSAFYEMEDKKTLTADSKIILDALKKYGSQELDDEFEKNFNMFVRKFDDKFNELKDKLQEEKTEVAGKILQWWEQTKNLQTYDEKMEAFAKYVKLYELD